MPYKKPLVGITPAYKNDENKSYLKREYYDGIYMAGGLPVILPPTDNKENLDDFLQRCDGLLLTGGADLDARHYGETNLPFNGEICPVRDSSELYLARKAIEQNKPVFGICRGIQVMNVAMGGTLFQDIHSQIKEVDILKHSQNAPAGYPTHEVIIEKGSKVWESFGRERAWVNSFHHQAVRDVGPGFAVTSRSVDGVIESIEYTANKFTVGVQWHPEWMWHENKEFLKLFEMFILSCMKRDLLFA